MTEQANNIDELRKHLFDTLRSVRSGEMDLDQARAVNEIGKTIIDSAKVEVEFLKVNGGGESEFLAGGTMALGNLPAGVTGVTRHRLR